MSKEKAGDAYKGYINWYNYNDWSVTRGVLNTQPGGVSVNPLESQEGGSHYKKYKIQPVEFCQKNNIPWCESNVIKYVCRHRDKNGIEDLKKAMHYLELLIKLDYE